jgi:hypothetical protein
MAWTDLQSYALKSLIERGFSFAETAVRLNREFGTGYTRNACIGRAQRLGFSGNMRPPLPKEEAKLNVKRRSQFRAERRKAERWAHNPNLAIVAERKAERAQHAKRVMASCRSKTSPTYRNQLPRVGNMTKNELRAMLAGAVVNTAAMEIA